ncbi:MAG: sugar MFS transporter [Bacteroidota bacterium]
MFIKNCSMSSVETAKKSNLIPIIIIGAFFFIFGFVTWLNSVLIPFLGISCELTNFQAFFVTFAFYISYFFMALPSSWVLKKVGFRNGMSLGLFIMALGSLLFIPAAQHRIFSLFLTGLFVQGTGLSILQTASNPYVAILGPIESAAKRISIMGVCNKVAGALSPIVLGFLILNDSETIKKSLAGLVDNARMQFLDDVAMRVVTPYLIMAVILVILAALVRLASLPEIEPEKESSESNLNTKTSIFSFPYLWYGVIALFLYVGVEVIAGDSIIRFGMQINPDPFIVNLFWFTVNLTDPLVFTSYTLIGMILGYFAGIICIPKFLKQENALAIFSLLGIVFSALAIMTGGMVSVIFIALLGFANSIMWPAIWPLAIQGLGKHLKTGSALLIMAIAGGALLPLVYGKLSDVWNMQAAYIIMIPCYLFILWYASMGHKCGRVKK